MTSKVVAQEFVIPTACAIVLAVAISAGTVYLMNNWLGPVDQAEVLNIVIGTLDKRP
jgi:hypothetical protein